MEMGGNRFGLELVDLAVVDLAKDHRVSTPFASRTSRNSILDEAQHSTLRCNKCDNRGISNRDIMAGELQTAGLLVDSKDRDVIRSLIAAVEE